MDERKRQKKLQKKKQKDKQRHARIAKAKLMRQQAENPINIIRNARKLPVYECIINPGWQESGLAQILLSRQQPNGSLTFGAYLVDLLCLGLKNTFCNCNLSPTAYAAFRSKFTEELGAEDCPVSLAHQIIYGAIDYAADLGFQPQKDFNLSKYILEERTQIEEDHNVEFGRDGKPFYISGPYDNAESIIRQLRRRVSDTGR